MTLADALVHDAHNQQTEVHWNEDAKALIAGLLMHVVASELASIRVLATRFDDLTLASAPWSRGPSGLILHTGQTRR